MNEILGVFCSLRHSISKMNNKLCNKNKSVFYLLSIFDNNGRDSTPDDGDNRWFTDTAIAAWVFSAFWRYLGIATHSHLFTSTWDSHLIGRQNNSPVYLDWPQVMTKSDSRHHTKPYPVHISDFATPPCPNHFTSTLYSLVEWTDFPTKPQEWSVLATVLMRNMVDGWNFVTVMGFSSFRKDTPVVITRWRHLNTPTYPFSEEIWKQAADCEDILKVQTNVLTVKR